MLTPTAFILLLLSLAHLPAESKKMNELPKTIAFLEGKLVKVKQNWRSKTDEKQASQDEELAELKDTMTTQEGNLTTLKDIVKTQSENLAEMEETVTTQDANLEGLNETVTAQEGDLTAVKLVMTTQDGDLAGLKDTLSTLVSKVAALEQANTDKGIHIASLEQSRTSLHGQMDTKSSQIATQSSQIASLEQTRTTQIGQIETQSSQIATQSSQIAALEQTRTSQIGQIDTQSSQIETQSSQIAALEQTKTTLISQISSQNERIETLESTKATLSTKVTDLERAATRIIGYPVRPDGLAGTPGDAACLVTCVGTTGPLDTRWDGTDHPGVVYTRVDISRCGFTATPIITASVEGRHYNDFMTECVRSAKKTEFVIIMIEYMMSPASVSATAHIPGTFEPTPSTASTWNWNVNWSATGYVC